jgi:hypothetical protein
MRSVACGITPSLGQRGLGVPREQAAAGPGLHLLLIDPGA